MTRILTCLFFLFAQLTNAQAPIEWQFRYGGTGSDQITDIEPTSDGGYIGIGHSWSMDGDITGHHGHNDKFDVWVVKLNSAGALQWQKSCGGTNWDYGSAIHQTHDGNYIFIGTTTSTNGDISGYLGGYSNAWIVKLDATGNIIWENTFGPAGGNGAEIVELENGHFVAAGTHQDKYWIYEIDSTGENVIWENHFGGSAQESLGSLARTADKGFIMTGSSWSTNGDVSGHHGPGTVYGDYWVVKVDSIGQLVWEKCLGGTYLEQSGSIIATSDGGSLVSGFSYSNDGDVSGLHADSSEVGQIYDAWIVKLDAQGNISWQRMFGGSNTEGLEALAEAANGNFIVAGFAASLDGDVDISQYHNNGDCWIVTLNPAGGIVSQTLIGGSEFDLVNSIYPTSDGGLVFAGYAGSSDGDVNTPPLSGYDDYWVVKLGALSAVSDLQNNPLKITPNPCRGVFNVESPAEDPLTRIYIMDALGRRVLEQAYISGQSVDLGDAPAGMYLVMATTQSGKKSVSKLVKE